MNRWLYIILGFCLTFSMWLEPAKLCAQDCVGCGEDDTLWTYPYDPCEFLLNVPWSSTTSRNIVVVFLAIGLGAIAGMIAGNVASKNNHKHHHKEDKSHKHHRHHHHRAVKDSGIGFSF